MTKNRVLHRWTRPRGHRQSLATATRGGPDWSSSKWCKPDVVSQQRRDHIGVPPEVEMYIMHMYTDEIKYIQSIV